MKLKTLFRDAWHSSVRSFRFRMGSFWHFVGTCFAKSDELLNLLFTFREPTAVIGTGHKRARVAAINYLNPLYWISQFFFTVFRYFASRTPVAFIQGIPACAAIAMPLVVCFWLPGRGRSVSDTIGRLEFFQGSKDFEAADFFSRKLISLDPQNPLSLMKRVHLLEAKGEIDSAQAFAKSVASDFQYVPAVVWLCRTQLLAMPESALIKDADAAQFLAWINVILKSNPRSVEGNTLLGSYHLKRQQFSSALAPLRLAFEATRGRTAEISYSYAMSLSATGDLAGAVAPASVAANEFLLRLGRDPQDAAIERMSVTSLIWSRREAEAIRYLSGILPLNPQRTDELKWTISEVYAAWSKRLFNSERASANEISESLTRIYQALSFAPQNPVVMEQLVSIACRKGFDDPRLEATLESALASGASPGMVHFIMGTRLLLKDPPEREAAMAHLNLAQAHDKGLPGLMNNLADTMIDTSPTDLAQAETLVEEAIRMMPEQPYFYDTRAKVRRKQGRMLEAIADYEKALAAEELRSDVHASLSTVYLETGNSELAAKHEALAKFFRTSQGLNSTAVKAPETQNP